MTRGFLGAGALALVLLASARGTRSRQSSCPREETRIILPAGFCTTVFADLVGMARHVVVGRSGAVFVAVGTVTGASVSHIASLRPDRMAGAILVLRDTSGDGHADVEA